MNKFKEKNHVSSFKKYKILHLPNFSNFESYEK